MDETTIFAFSFFILVFINYISDHAGNSFDVVVVGGVEIIQVF